MVGDPGDRPGRGGLGRRVARHGDWVGANPTGPGATPVTRTLRAVVPVTMPGETEVGDEQPAQLHPCLGRLIRFLQSVVVASPVYATRTLILENTSTISEFIGNVPAPRTESPSAGRLRRGSEREQNRHVKGTTTPTTTSAEVYIVGGCNTNNFDNNAANARRALRRNRMATSGIDQVWTDGGTAGTNSAPLPRLHPGTDVLRSVSQQPTLTPIATPPADSNMGRAYKTADLGPRAPVHDYRDRAVHLRRPRWA